MLKNRVHRRIRKEIADRSAYKIISSEGRVKLNAMESPYVWPTELQREWLLALGGIELNRYPDPIGFELGEGLRLWTGLRNESQIILGNGSDEIIQMIIMALGGPDRPVLAPEPTFGMYRLIAEATGTPFVGLPLTKDFAIDRVALLSAIDKYDPACIFLAYPNNPTGNLFDREVISAVINVANGLVIIDEAYHPYSGQTFLNDIGEDSHLAVLRTLSKLGLAGLRLGFLIGPDPWLAEINKVRLPYNISALTQVSALFALSHSDWFTQQVEKICEERNRVQHELQKLSDLIVYSSSTNFLLFRLLKADAGDVFESLLEQNILIKNLDGQHDALCDCLRVTVGTPDENNRFLAALRIAIKQRAT